MVLRIRWSTIVVWATVPCLRVSNCLSSPIRLLCSNMLGRNIVPVIRLWHLCIIVVYLPVGALGRVRLVRINVRKCRLAPRLLVKWVNTAKLVVDTANCGAVSKCTSDFALARLVVMRSNVTRLWTLGCLNSVEQLIMNAANLVRLNVVRHLGTRDPD